MSDSGAVLSRAGLPELPAAELGSWMARQRWFGAKAREPGQVAILDAVALSAEPPGLALLIVEVRAPSGTHDLYQVPVAVGQASDAPEPARIHDQDGSLFYDALADERQVLRLEELVARQEQRTAPTSTVRFRRAPREELPERAQSARMIRGEQSNSSVVLDGRRILKVFRRLEPGVNPELEMLSFLAAHGFSNIAPVQGFYEYAGELLDTTLGVMQRFVVGGRDGWELTLEALRTREDRQLADELGELGEVTGRMHTALASDSEDPEFAPEEPSDEHLALLTATIDEQIERMFLDMPERDALEPIRHRGEELRDRLSELSHRAVGGRLIRTHGDYHLGQTLLGPEGWIVLDFEGEPRRPLRERRRKRSPLRDVAGMLRSFAYASLAGELHDRSEGAEAWEGRVRASFLAGYMAEIDPSLLPAGTQAIEKQLALFELEKLLYELRYELELRPDWLPVPVRGIERLLAGSQP